jgi:MFS family permease
MQPQATGHGAVSIAAAGSANRNVAVLAASLFALAAGEELWLAYMPAYLTALGASGLIVGLYGSSRDLLDSLYQYPGGWLADHAGRRRALMTFTAIASVGYAVCALAPAWPFVLLGTIGVMAWKAGAFPTTFAVIGDAVPKDRRSAAFAVQSVLVRVPRVVSAPLGGSLIAAIGILAGVRVACAVTTLVGIGVLLVQHRHFIGDSAPRREAPPAPRLNSLSPELRRLLAAECLVRIGEGIAASFIVLYVIEVRQASAVQYGMLYALQQTIAIALYLPAGRLADRTGRRPLVALTFLFFATFPLAVRFAGSFPALVAAFVIGGLKEFGEPARKSLIVDLAPDDARASGVGVYYTIRNMTVVPAGIAGGLLWQQSPTLPLTTAFAVSTIGLLLYLFMSAQRDPPPPERLLSHTSGVRGRADRV